MVKIGSGGAKFAKDGLNDMEWILNRLPVAQGNSFIQMFWGLQRVRCEKPDSGLEQSGLKRKVGAK